MLPLRPRGAHFSPPSADLLPSISRDAARQRNSNHETPRQRPTSSAEGVGGDRLLTASALASGSISANATPSGGRRGGSSKTTSPGRGGGRLPAGGPPSSTILSSLEATAGSPPSRGVGLGMPRATTAGAPTASSLQSAGTTGHHLGGDRPSSMPVARHMLGGGNGARLSPHGGRIGEASSAGPGPAGRADGVGSHWATMDPTQMRSPDALPPWIVQVWISVGRDNSGRLAK